MPAFSKCASTPRSRSVSATRRARFSSIGSTYLRHQRCPSTLASMPRRAAWSVIAGPAAGASGGQAGHGSGGSDFDLATGRLRPPVTASLARSPGLACGHPRAGRLGSSLPRVPGGLRGPAAARRGRESPPRAAVMAAPDEQAVSAAPYQEVFVRRTVPAIAALSALALLAAACGSSTSGPSGSSSSSASSSAAAASFKGCMVTDTGGIDDRSFNESAWQAMQQVQSANPGKIAVKYLQSTSQSDYV